MLMESSTIKEVLVEAMDKNRALANQANDSARASLDGVARVIANLLSVIHDIEKGQEVNMKAVKEGLIAEIINLDEISARRRSSELEDKIKETLDKIPDGKAAKMQNINYGHLSTKISQMKKDNKIGKNVSVIKRGDVCYLAKH